MDVMERIERSIRRRKRNERILYVICSFLAGGNVGIIIYCIIAHFF